MRKLMRIIPAIAILVLASACAGGPVDPLAEGAFQDDEIDQTSEVQDEDPQDESPELRRALRLARARR